jgi:hypothetical protein
MGQTQNHWAITNIINLITQQPVVKGVNYIIAGKELCLKKQKSKISSEYATIRTLFVGSA